MKKTARTLFPILIFSVIFASCDQLPSSGDLAANKGIEAYEAGKLPQAAKDLERALVNGLNQTDEKELYTVLGNIYTDMEEYDLALQNHEKALEIDPEFYMAWVNIGVTHRNLNHLKKAEEAYLKAFGIEPNYPELHASLAALYITLEENEKSLKHALKAKELDRTIPLVWGNLSIAYAVNDDFDNAWKSLKQAEVLGYQKCDTLEQMIRDFQEIHDSLILNQLDQLPPQFLKRDNYSAVRQNFVTQMVTQYTEEGPLEAPAVDDLKLVSYDSPVGKLGAYLSVPEDSKQKYPAIIWISGGFSNTIGSFVWEEADPQNDQSAKVFRDAGVVTMYPSLRGGNGNPGYDQNSFGEVDDILAAAEYLAKVDYVDPEQIYLGGHSTGATLVLLTACTDPRFKGVFSFGPANEYADYGVDYVTFDEENLQERAVRAPIIWLDSIKSPVFIFEGFDGNYSSLKALERASDNPFIQCHSILEGNHFNILKPISEIIADKINLEFKTTGKIVFTEEDFAIFEED